MEEVDYTFVIQKSLVLLFCAALSWEMIIHMCNLLNIEKEPIISSVLVTGAARNVGYAIAPMIARGIMLCPDQPMILHLLLDTKARSEQSNTIHYRSSPKSAHRSLPKHSEIDAQRAIISRGRIRHKVSHIGMIYKAQASALDRYISDDCKVLAVTNPANTNTLILKEFTPSIPEEKITCLTRLDHNRAQDHLAEKLNVPVSSVKNVIVWGNHSSTQYHDTNYATVSTRIGNQPAKELMAEYNWLKKEFITEVHESDAAIIRARRQLSALSSATC
ncbi:hypothetical protein N665_0120s0012 [Sinapis alba]|nr:hypothetical protein N665_0120s0012 [Sinapis alba]